MAKIDYFKLIVSIIACQAAGLIGSIFTTSSVREWYPELTKPGFTPPGWLFAPVWTTLYLLMGIALYLVWSKGLKSRLSKQAVTVFVIQLVLNSLWSILFFGLKSPAYAFLEIILLWLAIIMSIFYFYRISRTAAYLLIPYILWVSFAGVLNLFIVLLN
jgi:tryptophan-rich sensory protein